MRDATGAERIRQKYRALSPLMDERMRRQWAAAEADAIGWGGVTAVAAATGLSRTTVAAGLGELAHRRAHPREPVGDRVRSVGGGRKPLAETDPGLAEALDALVDPATRGDPESPLRWTCKGTARLAEELTRRDHQVSDRTVATLLAASGYSLQANRKTREGRSHPDRDAQFRHIAGRVAAARRAGQPAVSVDTKEKELVGEFKNGGREWHPRGQPPEVNTHDFPSHAVGRAIPYGVYDLASNDGWVSVGVDHDTARFAAGTASSRWWRRDGAGRGIPRRDAS